MILAIVSVMIGIILLVYQFPIAAFNFNMLSLFSLSLLLIFFGVWLFYHDLTHLKNINHKMILWEDSIHKKEFIDYPSLELMCRPRILHQVERLIHKKRMQNASPILLHDSRIIKDHSKFSFFLWLFKEQDERFKYRCYARMFKSLHQATLDLLKLLLHPDDIIVDLSYTNFKEMKKGLYLLRHKETIELIKLPFHVRTVADDFYGHLIYDAKLDQPNYVWHPKEIQSSKTRVKQTSQFLFDPTQQKIKKPTDQTVYEYQWVISKDHQITFYSEQIPE